MLMPVALALLVALLSWRASRLACTLLQRRSLLDLPNSRSSHSAPTPRGGGLAVLGIALPVMGGVLLVGPSAPLLFWAVLAGALALAGLSWIDDLGHVPAPLRLIGHFAAVGLVLVLLPPAFLALQGLVPLWADRLFIALVWVWFINLFNFMDGIDGITGVETIVLGLGLFMAGLVISGGGAWVAIASAWGLILAAAAAGFLVLNWHPARLFLGDVGSIPLGFLLGFLLLGLALWGYWAAALILPAYYLADATLTLARRALAGAPPWQAHREHFYQRAVIRGHSHARVARFIALGNGALFLLAMTSMTTTLTGTLLTLAGAGGIVAVMLAWLAFAPAGKAA